MISDVPEQTTEITLWCIENWLIWKKYFDFIETDFSIPLLQKLLSSKIFFSMHLVLRHEMKYLLLATFNGLNGILVEQKYIRYYHHLSPFIDFLRGDRFSPVWLGVLVNPKNNKIKIHCIF